MSLASCEKHVNLLEGLGSLKSPDGNCEAVLSPGSRGLTIHRTTERNAFGVTITGIAESPVDWTNHPGAFVFFESNDRVWAFNGLDQSFILIKKAQGGVSYAFETYPGDFPSEVIKRLPESIASKYRNRVGKP